VQLDAVVIVLLNVRRITETWLYNQPRFFQAFADRGSFRCFAAFQFAAGEFPQARERGALGSLADKKSIFVLDDGDGDLSGHIYDLS